MMRNPIARFIRCNWRWRGPTGAGRRQSSAFQGSGESTVLAQHTVRFDSLLDRCTIYQLDLQASRAPTPLSLASLAEQAAQPSQHHAFSFITAEIPIRLANMIMELQLMPKALSSQPKFQEILLHYVQSFKEMLEFSAASFSEETNLLLIEGLQTIRLRHLDTVPHMAAAIQAMQADQAGAMTCDNIQYVLDRLYTNRISLHLLISLYRAVASGEPGLAVATINPACDVLEVARNAWEDAQLLCEREYGETPELEVTGLDSTRPGNQYVDSVTLPAAPHHIHHIFFEIFKNAMRATVEQWSAAGRGTALPPVRCLVSRTKEEVAVRVSDQGGGIKREEVPGIFRYHYTTATAGSGAEPGRGGLQSPAHPMHGLGYGMPLSRVYARYFGGDLDLLSMLGHGTDVYFYLVAAGARETLPRYSIGTAEMIYKQNKARVSDWTI